MIQEISGEPSPEERENLTWAALATLGGGLDTVRTLAIPKLDHVSLARADPHRARQPRSAS